MAIGSALSALCFANHDWFGAVDDRLGIHNGAHLLVGLHVDGLRSGVYDRALVIDGRRHDVDRGLVNAWAGLLAPLETGAVAEGEAPGIGLGGGGECRGECGEEKNVLHDLVG